MRLLSAVILCATGCVRQFEKLSTTGVSGLLTGRVLTGTQPMSAELSIESQRAGRGRQVADVGDDGVIAVELDADTYRVTVKKEGYVAQTFAGVVIQSGPHDLGDVALERVGDSVPPSIISLTLAPADFVSGDSVLVTLSAFDDRSSAELSYALGVDALDCNQASYERRFDGCTVTPCTVTEQVSTTGLSPGPHRLIACVRDSNGLVSAPQLQAFVFDPSPPTPADGLLVAPGSRHATVTWVPAEDADSPVVEQVIEVSEDAAFSTLTKAVSVPASADQADVRVLDNYQQYYFRVRAKNAAGLEATSPAQARLLGFGKTPVTITSPGNSIGPHALFADKRRIFAANAYVSTPMAGAEDPSAVQLRSCDVVTDDCSQPSAWVDSAGMSFLSNGSALIRPSFAQTNRALYFAFKAITSASANCDVRVYRCANGLACQYAFNWTLVSIDTYAYSGGGQCSELGDGQLAAYGDAVLYAYSKNRAPTLAVCAEDTGCDAAADWSKVSPLPVASLSDVSVATDGSAVFVAGVKNATTIQVARCAARSGCDAVGDFTTFDVAASAESPDGAAYNTRLVLDKNALHLVYDRYRTAYMTPFGFRRTYLRRCPLDSVCAGEADFSAPISLVHEHSTDTALSADVQASVSAMPGRLMLVHRSAVDGAIRYMQCTSDDCGLPAAWVASTMEPEAARLPRAPVITSLGTAVIAAYHDDSTTLMIRAPRIMPAAGAVVAPTLSGLRATFSPMATADGYEVVYSSGLVERRAISTSGFDTRISVPIAGGAPVTSAAVRALRGADTSDDSPPVDITPLNLNGSWPAPTGGLPAEVVSRDNVVAVLSVYAGSVSVASCDLTQTSCDTSASFRVASFPATTAYDIHYRLRATSQALYLARFSQAGGMQLRRCPLASDCGSASNWSPETTISSTLYDANGTPASRRRIRSSDTRASIGRTTR